MNNFVVCYDFAVLGYSVHLDWDSQYIPKKDDYIDISEFHPKLMSIVGGSVKKKTDFKIGHTWKVDYTVFFRASNYLWVRLTPPDYLDETRGKDQLTELEWQDWLQAREANP